MKRLVIILLTCVLTFFVGSFEAYAIDWNVNANTTSSAKAEGYAAVINQIREFVKRGGVSIRHEQININRANANEPPSLTTLRIADNNFQVTHINSNPITYNYPTNLPVFDPTVFPTSFPIERTQVNDNQKVQLLYLFPEAARSDVLRLALQGAFHNSNRLALVPYAVLVNNYAKTSVLAGLDPAHPTRALICTDYCWFAATLAPNIPDRASINSLCKCNL